MRLFRIKTAILVVAFSLLAVCRAADTIPGRIPAPVFLHVSVASPNAFLDNLDAFVAESLKGTPQGAQFQPGMIRFMAMMTLGLPLDAFNLDGDAHLLLALENGEKEEYAAVLSVASFDDTIKSFEEAGGEVEKIGKTAGVTFPNSHKEVFFTDIGDGKILLTDDNAMAKKYADILSQWKPAHSGDGVISANFDNVNIAPVRKKAIDEALKEMRTNLADPKILADLADGPVDPAVTLKVLKSFLGVFDKLVAGADSVRNIRLSLRLGAAEAGLSCVIAAEKDSLMGKMGEKLSAQSNPDFKLMAEADAEALSISAVEFVNSLIPDYGTWAGNTTDEFLDGPFPELKADARRIIDAMLAAGMGETVTVEYMIDGRDVTVSYGKMEKPEEYYNAISDTFKLVNAMLAKVFSKAGDLPRISLTDEKEGDFSYRAIRLEGDFEKFLDAIPEESRSAIDKLITPDGRIAMICSNANTMVVVAGEAGPEQLKAVFDEVGKNANPVVETEAAKIVLKKLEHRQGGVTLFNASRFLLKVLEMVASNPGSMMYLDEDEFADLTSQVEIYPDMLGISFGATDGAIRFDSTVPSGVVKALVKNYASVTNFMNSRSDDDEVIVEEGDATDESGTDQSDTETDGDEAPPVE